MKPHYHEINFPKLILYSFALTTFFLSSCSSIDNQVDIQPVVTQERVDLNIDGDIISEIHNESEDLSTYSNRPDPIVNSGERLVRIKMDENSFVDLTLYQKYFNDPLQELYQYGAFAKSELSSKPAYIVADYYIDGQRVYCSAPDHLENRAQYNVFRVTEMANHYLIRIENLRLFNIVNKRKLEDENYVEFYGTFTLLK